MSDEATTADKLLAAFCDDACKVTDPREGTRMSQEAQVFLMTMLVNMTERIAVSMEAQAAAMKLIAASRAADPDRP